MIVPKYWSEATVKKVVDGRRYTLKRFGWSDISEEDAAVHADKRLQEAVKTLENEGDVRRIDHKSSYNGAEGIPIREEVVTSYQEAVVSRNSYGSLCLNTPDIFFADIDLQRKTSRLHYLIALTLLSGFAIYLYLNFNEQLPHPLSVIGLFILTPLFANIIHRCIDQITGGTEKAAIKQIKAVSKQHNELNIRLYKTPNGYRVLLMNDIYAPRSEATIQLMSELKSDPRYIQMCVNQNCFRARVSPKPWRVGFHRIKPGSRSWPINSDQMQRRKYWIDQYQRKSIDYASCHFIMQLGSDLVSSKAEYVRKIHDEMCKANRSELKIA